KTICREPRLGNPTPRMAETEAGIIQSIGLPGKGIEYFIDHIVPEYARFTPPLIVSVSSDNVEDFAALAAELSIPDVDVIEANISCPTRNLTGQNFAMHEDYTRDCITAIRAKTKKPLWVKLSPNAGDIVSIAKAAETAGADCLVIANTFLSLKIRTDNFRPALGNKFGGLVSPALKPIVLRMVYQVAKQVKIPIIGIGGVKRAYSGTMWSMKYSMPFPGRPIDWMMPASVSAMRGVGLPSRGSRQMVLATRPPSRLRSMTSLYSQEKAPDAGVTGFCRVMSPIFTERSTIPPPPAC
ncbi:MAG TPA: hypothetical protein VE200_01475, partial [Xanthobacteraceae bacterium]|nr:hypothetical protein [Xanthobacteraceae bacterium]